MNYLLLAVLTLTEVIIGYGILLLLSVNLGGTRQIALSLILGIATVSAIPFLLQLFYIPLTQLSVFTSIGITAATLSIINIRHFRQLKLNYKFPAVALYEWPWLLFTGAMLLFAVCRCFVTATIPRDALSGPEPIAEFALREHSFINSVFRQDFPHNNNPFKSIYIPALQLVYKMIGFPLGKVWVAALSSSFVIFLYSSVRKIIHPALAGLVMILFLFTPELYAYMYMMLYDYSNMIFFFLSLFFLKEYLDTNHDKYILFSSLLMGIATYIRPETLILAVLVAGYSVAHQLYRKKYRLSNLLLPLLLIVVASFVYFLTSYIYLNYYLPVVYDIGENVNNNLMDITPLISRLTNIATLVIFGNDGVKIYGYIFWLSAVLIIGELVMYKRFTPNGTYWLSMLLITYFGIGLIGYLLPLADLENTTKRSLFKVIPILVMCISSSKIVYVLSQKLVQSTQSGTTATAKSTVKKSGKFNKRAARHA